MTQSEFLAKVDAFFNKYNGQRITAPGGIGGQCVDLINQFVQEYLGFPHFWANAIDIFGRNPEDYTWVTNDPKDPAYYHAMIRTFDVPAVAFDTVTAQVHMRPIDFEFVDDLIASGDLAAKHRARVTTFTLAGSVRRWTRGVSGECVP